MIKLLDFRWHGKDDTYDSKPEFGAEWWTSNPRENGSVTVIGYSGKRNKPDFHYSFRNIIRAEQYVNEWLAGLARRAEYKTEKRAAAKKFVPTLEVGDILNGSWGYDQTNQEWWQVTKLVGKQSVEVRKIAANYIADGPFSGIETPIKNRFIEREPAVIKRVQAGNRLSFECFHLSKWDGGPRHSSDGH